MEECVASTYLSKNTWSFIYSITHSYFSPKNGCWKESVSHISSCLSRVPFFPLHLIGIILRNLRLIQMKQEGFWQEKKRLRLNITRIPLKGTPLYWRKEIWCEESLRKKRRRLSTGSWQQKVLSLMIRIVMTHCSQHGALFPHTNT